MKLWSRLRRKQLCNTQFYRQKPIGDYIVDFYAPKAKLVVEVDGSQHLEQDAVVADTARTEGLVEMDLKVIRFDNLQILRELESVVASIYETILMQLGDP